MQSTDLIASAVARPVSHPVGEAASFPYKAGDSPRHGTPKGFDGLLSGGAFAVLVLICLALGALVLLA